MHDHRQPSTSYNITLLENFNNCARHARPQTTDITDHLHHHEGQLEYSQYYRVLVQRFNLTSKFDMHDHRQKTSRITTTTVRVSCSTAIVLTSVHAPPQLPEDQSVVLVDTPCLFTHKQRPGYSRQSLSVAKAMLGVYTTCRGKCCSSGPAGRTNLTTQQSTLSQVTHARTHTRTQASRTADRTCVEEHEICRFF